MNNQWAAPSNAEWRVGTCTFALIRATLSNQRASVVVNLWGAGSVREKVWKGGGGRGVNNEVAILNFLCENVFTNEVAILNGRKVWFRESKVEIEHLECSGKYFVSSSKQRLSISILFVFKHTTLFFSTVLNAGWQKVQQSFKFQPFGTKNCIQYIWPFL